jgi:hypothetical protein
VRWLAGRPWWLLAGAFVLVLVGVVLGREHSIWLLSGVGVVTLFLLFFATLMAVVACRQHPRPPSPH